MYICTLTVDIKRLVIFAITDSVFCRRVQFERNRLKKIHLLSDSMRQRDTIYISIVCVSGVCRSMTKQ